jgi:hypothetical protein
LSANKKPPQMRRLFIGPKFSSLHYFEKSTFGATFDPGSAV